jgi:hypothetical protein
MQRTDGTMAGSIWDRNLDEKSGAAHVNAGIAGASDAVTVFVKPEPHFGRRHEP